MKAFLACVICATLLLTAMLPAGMASAETMDKKSSDAKSAIVIEQETGQVLYQKNANQELPPASMTKVMTLLLIFKALSQHRISLTDKVSVSEHAASMGGSQVFLEPGETMTVDEMLKAIAIASGNDASVAMAEFVSGSEKEFVKQMNQEAAQLGLKHTHFENTTGLPVKNHYTTAHDMAIMAQALAQYKQVFNYTSKYEDYLRQNTDQKFWLVNTNKLIRSYPGADGMKTGFTNEAKYCLTATAMRKGMRVIAVVMGAATPKERNSEIAGLMDQAFATYTTKKVQNKGQVMAHLSVDKGNPSHLSAVTGKPVVLLIKKGDQTGTIKQKTVLNKNLQAPIKAGTPVGYYEISSKGQPLSNTPLVAGENVKRAGWWQLFTRVSVSILTK
jgi:D-alanyl-D-alanine carboxypeptidase